MITPMQVSKDEEELAKKRLEVKRGLPLQVKPYPLLSPDPPLPSLP